MPKVYHTIHPLERWVLLPEVGAVCGNSARTDLCGGCQATGIPIATMNIIVKHGSDKDFDLYLNKKVCPKIQQLYQQLTEKLPTIE